MFCKAWEERRAFNCVYMQDWDKGIPHAYCLHTEMDVAPFHGSDFPNLNSCLLALPRIVTLRFLDLIPQQQLNNNLTPLTHPLPFII